MAQARSAAAPRSDPQARRPVAWLLIASLPITAGALATSGDYERFIEIDGQRYCHVLDPRSGWPVRHWQSITVLGPTCAAAGAAPAQEPPT